MKPHLPITLLTVLLSTFAAQAVEIPDSYEQIDLKTSSDLDDYLSNSADNNYAFLLQANVDFTPTSNTTWNASTPLIKGGNLLFTTDESDTPAALSFINGQSTAFAQVNSQAFDTISNLTFTNNHGGAFLLGNYAKLHIRNIKDEINDADVVFSKNKSTLGGAICANGAAPIIDISENDHIIFSENYTATPASASSSCGGAIFSRGNISLNHNVKLVFNGNFSTSSSSSAQGGAIYSTGTLGICDNTNVTFNGNYVTSSSFNNDAHGGAIYSTGTVNINNNTVDVTFSGNRATSGVKHTSCGGAIYSTGTLNIINNADVTFSGNYSATSSSTSASSPSNAYGGAIYSTGSININNNSDVSFSGNYISYTSPSGYLSYTLGSAIYSKSGSITIEGNDSVTFEKNYIRRASTYNLQSIHMAPTASNDNLVLAAKTGGHITFNDSVYMEYSSLNPTVSLNSDYLDANGVTQKAEGTIVFSGKYTEEHLKEIKGATAITATEIDNSRTSQLLNTVNLYGGTLSVEDKAVLKTHAINVVAGSNATMIVKDAQVDTTGSTDYDITVSNSGALIITGSNGSTRIIAGNINIQEGASLSLTRTEVATENVPMTLAAVDGLSVYNDKIGGIVCGNLNLSGGATYIANGAHLGMDDGTLTFLASAENKTNLVLTIGAQYEKDAQILLFSNVDKAIFGLDNITMKPFMDSVTLQASDYFTGEWINDETTLVYDGGNIYVSGVNVVIPEPTTATLSLLALAGLAARRRRKS